LTTLASLTLLSLALTPTLPTLAITDTKNLDLAMTAEPAISLTQSNCNSTTNPDKNLLTLSVSPTSPFASDCHNLTIDYNTPGYELSIKAEATNPNYNSGNTTNALLYTDPTPPIPFPTIPATAATNTITAPNPLSTANTWGFAVEGLPDSGFDTVYTNNSNTNKYAYPPPVRRLALSP
jgi:hypothetical protein